MPTFESQLLEFWSVIETSARYSIDPAWLAVLSAILSMAANSITKKDRDHLGWPSTEKTSTVNLWFAASCLSLFVADWSGRPQIRCLQVRYQQKL
jgi:hypothetical protein